MGCPFCMEGRLVTAGAGVVGVTVSVGARSANAVMLAIE